MLSKNKLLSPTIGRAKYIERKVASTAIAVTGMGLCVKILYVCAAMALCVIAAPNPADAKGCLKGAVVGGVAGHYAGHHGLVGAAIGCAIGHHEAAKHDREEARKHDREGAGDERLREQ